MSRPTALAYGMAGLALVISVGAAFIGGKAYLEARDIGLDSADFGRATIDAEVRHIYERREKFNDSAEGMYFNLHRAEIVKTVEVASSSASGDLALVMVRYSVGDKVFRDSLWMRQLDGKWYYSNYYMSKYSLEQPEKLSASDKQRVIWLTEMVAKKDDWDANTAKPFD